MVRRRVYRGRVGSIELATFAGGGPGSGRTVCAGSTAVTGKMTNGSETGRVRPARRRAFPCLVYVGSQKETRLF